MKEINFKDCFFVAEDTRLSNPPSNLRGTGINRFEWLCKNPQNNIEVPFDYNISNRIVVKDNHRPLIPTPIDQTLSLPKGGDLPCQKTMAVCSNYTNAPSVHWRQCSLIKKY